MFLPNRESLTLRPVVRGNQIGTKLLGSSRLEVRTRAHRKYTFSVQSLRQRIKIWMAPGGRHDNNFADVRKIAILLTPDELASKDPFSRRAADVQAGDTRSHYLVLHTDNQFRLLREDLPPKVRQRQSPASQNICQWHS
jgi:hypothetical protein